MAEPEKPERSGGLYKNVRISVRTLDLIILAGIAVLVGVTILLVSHGGFTVTFDSDGGSQVASQVRMYGELVKAPAEPSREGWRFTGWYRDREKAERWDLATEPVTESMTLYAGWEPADG